MGLVYFAPKRGINAEITGLVVRSRQRVWLLRKGHAEVLALFREQNNLRNLSWGKNVQNVSGILLKTEGHGDEVTSGVAHGTQ
jgi:hypothetical protein